MHDLVTFILRRLDDDQRIAEAATEGPWRVNDEQFAESIDAADGVSVVAGGRWGGEAPAFETTEDAIHIARHDPRRVLTDVEAKRAIVESAALVLRAVPSDPNDYALVDSVEAEQQSWLHDVLIPLARVWSDHPDSDPSWAS